MRTELQVDALKVHLQAALDQSANRAESRLQAMIESGPIRLLVYSLQRVGCSIVMKRADSGQYLIE